MSVDIDQLLEAVEFMASTLGDAMTGADAGRHFTCTEAESIADVMIAGGFPAQAEAWLAGHAAGDEDPEDSHHEQYQAGLS